MDTNAADETECLKDSEETSPIVVTTQNGQPKIDGSQQTNNLLGPLPPGAKVVKVVHTCGRDQDDDSQVCASVFDLTYDPASSPPQSGKQKNVWPQILASLSAASFHLPVGIVVGFSAILIPALESPDSEIKVSKKEIGLIASLAVLVVPVGALFTGILVDSIGRLRTIKLAAIPYVIGWVLIALTDGLPLLFLGRFLTGFAMAMGPSPAIVYITEVARPDLRGSLICTGPSMTSLGMLFVYVKGAFLHWRTVAWLSIFYAVVPIFLMYIWSPESPVWLLSKGRADEALESLKVLSRFETTGGTAERQLAAMQKENETTKSTSSNQKSFFKRLRGFCKPTGYKPFLILVMMFFFQQFSGVYITIFYAVSFFQSMGSSIDAYVSSILIGTIRMLVGLLTSGLLKRFGRRPLCMISGLGMGVSLAVSAYFTQLVHSGEMTSSWIPVAGMLVYMTLSVIGLLSIPWTMTAELFPIEIRGIAQGLTVSVAHIIMFTALQIYPILPDILGGPYMVTYMFSAVSFASVIFVFIFLPETHKQMLSDIQEYFHHNTIFLLKKSKPPTETNGSQPV